MTLTDAAKKSIRHDSNLRAKLMLKGNISEYTIKRWLEKDCDDLTKPLYTNVIVEHTGLALADVLKENAN